MEGGWRCCCNCNCEPVRIGVRWPRLCMEQTQEQTHTTPTRPDAARQPQHTTPNDTHPIPFTFPTQHATTNKGTQCVCESEERRRSAPTETLKMGPPRDEKRGMQHATHRTHRMHRAKQKERASSIARERVKSHCLGTPRTHPMPSPSIASVVMYKRRKKSGASSAQDRAKEFQQTCVSALITHQSSMKGDMGDIGTPASCRYDSCD
jgi:hypothetical protein